MKLQNSSNYLATKVQDQIDDIAYVNMMNLQDLNETTFLKSYENDHINYLRKEITFENMILNRIELENNKIPANFAARLSK